MNRSSATLHESRDPWTDRAVTPDTSLPDELLTVQDAARFLNVTVSWVYEHTREGVEERLPFVKLGKYLRFDRTDLRAYIDAKRNAARRRPSRR